MRPLHTYALLAALLCGCGSLLAQPLTPDAYFDRAAREYVKEDKGSALRILEKGLREHPGDPRLLKLAEELLKEEQQEPQEVQPQSGEGDGDDQPQQQPQPGDGADEREHKEPRDRKEPNLPDRISPKDAERILDAMEREEKEVRDRVRDRQRPAPRTPIEKDW
jgi:hypothetical protein